VEKVEGIDTDLKVRENLHGVGRFGKRRSDSAGYAARCWTELHANKGWPGFFYYYYYYYFNLKCEIGPSSSAPAH
jgi:hypothetical protein